MCGRPLISTIRQIRRQDSECGAEGFALHQTQRRLQGPGFEPFIKDGAATAIRSGGLRGTHPALRHRRGSAATALARINKIHSACSSSGACRTGMNARNAFRHCLSLAPTPGQWVSQSATRWVRPASPHAAVAMWKRRVRRRRQVDGWETRLALRAMTRRGDRLQCARHPEGRRHRTQLLLATIRRRPLDKTATARRRPGRQRPLPSLRRRVGAITITATRWTTNVPGPY